MSLQLFRNRTYHFLLIAWGVGLGTFNVLITLLQQYLCPWGYEDVGVCCLDLSSVYLEVLVLIECSQHCSVLLLNNIGKSKHAGPLYSRHSSKKRGGSDKYGTTMKEKNVFDIVDVCFFISACCWCSRRYHVLGWPHWFRCHELVCRQDKEVRLDAQGVLHGRQSWPLVVRHGKDVKCLTLRIEVLYQWATGIWVAGEIFSIIKIKTSQRFTTYRFWYPLPQI